MAIRNTVRALITRGASVLVIEKRDARGAYFLLPGGGQRHGETLIDAIRRECSEEIGADVQVSELLFVRDFLSWNHDAGNPDPDFQVLELTFRCSVPTDYEPRFGARPDARQIATRWLPLAELTQVRFLPRALAETLQRSQATSLYLGDVN
jgi:ADP-ribose pyrophosphatase YjhB (NUDIX family)